MPPTQEEKDRQKRMPLGRDSMSARMVAPEVVKPETISKRQSAKPSKQPENQKGRAPKRLRTTQMRPATTKPSRKKKSALALIRERPKPTRARGRMVYRKGVGSSR